MVISEINIFPVKSLRGISLAQCELDELGIAGDRRWMLVDNNNTFVTQRQIARMCLINVEIRGTNLNFSAPTGSIHFNSDDLASEPIEVLVWNDKVQALAAPKSINQWFSDFLNYPVTLVYFSATSSRPVDSTFRVTNNDKTGFSDGFPILLISQASLDLLNQKLTQAQHPAVPMNRFRPNIVVSNVMPHEEDQWKVIAVNGIKFHLVKPCSRCIIPTIDINNGGKSKEPLVTLRRYRQRDNKIYFGQNVIHRGRGTIKVGDAVQILETR